MSYRDSVTTFEGSVTRMVTDAFEQGVVAGVILGVLLSGVAVMGWLLWQQNGGG